MRLNGVYSLFCCIDSVIIGFDQKVVALFYFEKVVFYLTCLIVHDVWLHCEPFWFEEFILLSVCGEDAVVAEVHNRQRQNCIQFLVIHNEKADFPLKGHERKSASQVCVQNSRVFISEGGKTENVGFGVFVGFDYSSACCQAVKTNARVGVDILKRNQIIVVVIGRLNRRSWVITGVSTQCVLQIPWRGCFIWPLAVAELGLRYLVTQWVVNLGHPLR